MENLVASISALGYDFVLIDCPAGIDVGFINAISPAQEALIVTTPEITAIRDADRVAGLLEANGIYNTKLLVNRVRTDMIQKNDMMSVRDVAGDAWHSPARSDTGRYPRDNLNQSR